jgi:hypothetical protein
VTKSPRIYRPRTLLSDSSSLTRNVRWMDGVSSYEPSLNIIRRGNIASCMGPTAERGGRDTSSRNTLSRDISSIGRRIPKKYCDYGTIQDSGVIFLLKQQRSNLEIHLKSTLVQEIITLLH